MVTDLEKSTADFPSRLRPRLLRIFYFTLAFLVIAFLAICFIIGHGVNSISEKALRDHPGDKVAALMALVESEQHTYHDRNHAVWALGQLGDPRALPLLRKYYTGGESDENTSLSQYELEKAIALCEGETNIGAFIWRHGSWGAN
ncbi:MAG: hypothetical protein MUF59_08810 [Candidatus Krumholzibacteria bacterium]|nr:hypothetical protein [Candidatus Krumholzibacteria bacterium]